MRSNFDQHFLGYIAGIFDERGLMAAEIHQRIVLPDKVQLSLALSCKDRRPLLMVAKRYGGDVVEAGTWTWRVSSPKVIRHFLSDIVPLLFDAQPKALLMLSIAAALVERGVSIERIQALIAALDELDGPHARVIHLTTGQEDSDFSEIMVDPSKSVLYPGVANGD